MTNEFGTRLALLRKSRNFTQNQLSRVLCVTKATVSGWETGRREPDVRMLKKLAQVLEVTGDELLGTQPIADEKSRALGRFRVTDSGMEPEYRLGDLVYVRSCPDAEEGETALVQTDEGMVLRRVYHIPGGLRLVGNARVCPPRDVLFREGSPVRILGVPVGFVRIRSEKQPASSQ